MRESQIARSRFYVPESTSQSIWLIVWKFECSMGQAGWYHGSYAGNSYFLE